jgi:hypothetical protein
MLIDWPLIRPMTATPATKQEGLKKCEVSSLLRNHWQQMNPLSSDVPLTVINGPPEFSLTTSPISKVVFIKRMPPDIYWR